MMERGPVADDAGKNYVPALRFPALTRFYDPVVAATTREKTFRSLLLQQANVQPGQRVLDLGCGTGTFAVAVKQRQPEAEVFGVDGDPDVLDRARRKAESAGTEVSFDHGRAEQLPYEDGSFDVVTSSLFFHHLDLLTKEQAASEIARVLRSGGELHVADWGPPGDPLMAVASLAIRLLDGFAPTRDNVAGRLPLNFSHGGLVDARERGRLRTMLGAMVFYSARRPGMAAVAGP
jgi:ubiquinone/menaquinone biosynthesis C-methylase UbiE